MTEGATGDWMARTARAQEWRHVVTDPNALLQLESSKRSVNSQCSVGLSIQQKGSEENFNSEEAQDSRWIEKSVLQL
jgi:hypothetical protein